MSSEKSSQTENISVLRKPKSALHHTHPVPARGAYHDRHDRGAGRGGRWQCRQANGVRAYGEVVWSRRRGAGVNAPGGNSFQGATEAKEPFSGENSLLSRKAIAQGMSDVLRCPVCSCAHFFYHCT